MHYKVDDIALTNIWVDNGEASLKQEGNESILNGSGVSDKNIDAAQVLLSNVSSLSTPLRHQLVDVYKQYSVW